MSVIHSHTPSIPMLEVFLVQGDDQLRTYKRFEDHTLHPMDGALAKACHLTHNKSGEEVIVVVYPTLLSDKPFAVTQTLLHEAVHCWDFIRNTYGYGNDTELNAYAIESIFTNLHKVYMDLLKAKKMEKRNAKTA